jgi:hypothetical protein
MAWLAGDLIEENFYYVAGIPLYWLDEYSSSNSTALDFVKVLPFRPVDSSRNFIV